MRLNKDVGHPINMPKLQSPFVREVVNGVYVCTPKIDDRYRWVFTEETEATEKLDGTNVSIVVKERFIDGILESIEREIVDVEKL